MQIILATDIFGLTRHVEVLAGQLRQRGQLPEIISPFAGSQSFVDEGQGYQFSVPDLIERLQGQPGVTCLQVPWQHGYMNRLSRNFDLEGYRRTLAWLDGLLERPGRTEEGEDYFRSFFSMGS